MQQAKRIDNSFEGIEIQKEMIISAFLDFTNGMTPDECDSAYAFDFIDNHMPMGCDATTARNILLR